MKDDDGALVRRALYECALFSGLDNAHRDLVCKVAEARTLLAGAPIFLLGQEASEVLVIADGGVALQLPVAIRGKGADITIEEKGREIYELMLRVASGEESKSEAQGLGDYEFVPWQIGATM